LGYSDNFAISPDGRWLVSDGIVFAMPDGRAVSLLCAPGKNSEWKRKPYVQGDALVDPASGRRTHEATLANMRQLHFSPDGRSLDGWHDLLLLRFPVDGNGIGPGVAVTKFALPDVQTIRSSINTVMKVTEHGQSREVRIEHGVVIGDDGGFDRVNWIVTSELNRLEQDCLVQKYPSGAWIWTRENARVWRTGKAGWSPLDLDYRPFHMASDPSGQRMAVWHNGGINAVSIYTIEGTLIRRWVMEGHNAAVWSRLAWLPGDRVLVSGATNRFGNDPVWWQLDLGASDDRLPPQTSGWPVTGPDGSPVGTWDGQTLTLKDRDWTIALPSKPTWGKGTSPMTDAAGRWFIMYLGAGGLLVVDLTTGTVCHPAAGVTLAKLSANSQF
jgi:hypothetical protein